jgi:hypothetical protein
MGFLFGVWYICFMKQTKFFKPYKKPQSTNLKFTEGKSGVYIIKRSGATKPLYVGMSGSNLYKTITRHFQSWPDPSQVRVTYSQKSNIVIRVILTTPKQAERLEKYLILKYKPTDNPGKIANYQLDAFDKSVVESYSNVLTSLVPDDFTF